MSKWAYVENNVAVELYDDVPQNWRNISNFIVFADDLNAMKSFGWFPVNNITKLIDPNKQTYGQVTYTFDQQNEVVIQNEEILPLPNAPTDEELFQIHRESFLQQLTEIRDQLLQKCDWTQLSDILEMKTEEWISFWRSYRQQLRDLPNVYRQEPYLNETDISRVVFPTQPNT